MNQELREKIDSVIGKYIPRQRNCSTHTHEPYSGCGACFPRHFVVDQIEALIEVEVKKADKHARALDLSCPDCKEIRYQKNLEDKQTG